MLKVYKAKLIRMEINIILYIVFYTKFTICFYFVQCNFRSVMSADKDRKRGNRAQGWEEAGEEFYRESYAGEFDILPKDPSRLTTFLPSKKNRSRKINTQYL